MKIGYARVSTDEQSLDVQLEQLKAAGCKDILKDKLSGKTAERVALQKLLAIIEGAAVASTMLEVADDPIIVVVTKLDRLARNTRDLLEIADRLARAGAGLVSLAEPWANSTNPAGRFVLTTMAGVAEFERSRILERTSEGRKLAMRRGVKFGRPAKLSKEQQRAAREMMETHSIRSVSRVFGVNRKTLAALRDGK